VTDLDLSKALNLVRKLSNEVGEYQLERRGKARVEFKGPRELVTEVDRESEERIVAGLLAAYPDHDIFAEETWQKDERKSPYRWIIDPVDGTTNYAHGLPLFAISIGLEKRTESSSEIVAGLIHAPAMRETFHAIKGQGSFLNDEAISVTQCAELKNGILATGFAYVRHKSANNNLDNWSHLAMTARDLRRLGSAAIDMAYVAAGRFDGFWEYHLQPYDVAAGAIIIQEAGGRVTDTEGGPDWLFGRRIIATNTLLHEALQAELKPVQDDGFIPVSQT
jgi:myo-inositol-1(or 4)-monophosphatase